MDEEVRDYRKAIEARCLEAERLAWRHALDIALELGCRLHHDTGVLQPRLQ